MDEFRFDSYCGLYCGACDVLMAYKAGKQDEFAVVYNEKFSRIYPDIKVTPSQIKCNGCKTDSVFVNCAFCSVRKCAIEKKVENCVTCYEYPCAVFTPKPEMKETMEKLPHLKIIPKNLKTIKEHGTEHWLSEQRDKWKCPKCYTAFSWWALKCSNCGLDLEPYKDYNSVTEDDF